MVIKANSKVDTVLVKSADIIRTVRLFLSTPNTINNCRAIVTLLVLLQDSVCPMEEVLNSRLVEMTSPLVRLCLFLVEMLACRGPIRLVSPRVGPVGWVVMAMEEALCLPTRPTIRDPDGISSLVGVVVPLDRSHTELVVVVEEEACLEYLVTTSVEWEGLQAMIMVDQVTHLTPCPRPSFGAVVVMTSISLLATTQLVLAED